MQFTFSTVYTAIIASNLLIILLTLCIRNTKIMVNTGYKLLSVFAILTLIRFVLPFELPFTQTIIMPEWLSFVISKVRHPFYYVGEYELSIWTVLLIIWFIGFLVKLIKYIRLETKTRYYILSHMWDVTSKERYQSILSKICTDAGKKNSFVIVEVAGLNTPLLYGIFKPHILLPKDYQIPEKDLYYVLAHEASHHFHHDLVTKMMMQFIDMIYWWNPFCRTLVKQTTTILEMRIDDVITLADQYDIRDYLYCLVELTEHVAKDCPISNAVTMPLLTRSEKETDGDMSMRFEMLAAHAHKKNHVQNVALLLSVILIYLSSYAFIWEACYAAPENIENTFTSESPAFYAILREDNTYDIYYNGNLMENTDSIEYHIGIQIYTEKEFYNEEH